MALRRFEVPVNRFAQLPALLQGRLRDVAFIAATNIAEKAAASMEGDKTGRTYRVRGTKAVTHRASAPGEAPAIDTGILHGSLFVKESGPAAFIVGTNVEYAPHLEYGTVNMEARPFLLPAFEDERPDFERAVAAAVASVK